MLLNLLLANTTILLCFVFLFRVIFNNFFKIPAVIENAKLKLALAVPPGTSIKTANDTREMLPLADETIKNLSKLSKGAIYLRSRLLINSLSLISAIK